MALALYRKYRPATFAEVIGQEHVTDPLRIALGAGRVNHAYLFSGPRGCGKTSSARILARSLNCAKGPTPDPCGECNSCVGLAPNGPGSVDVVELDAASHGGVDDTRELREKAFYAPAEAKYRVFIIDEAHMVTTQGFNALLKIVEEPPEHLIFIFATTEPDKVLPTIRSRTHHYPFRLIPPVSMRALLERNCAAEGVVVEPSVFPLVIRAGGGSARDTQSVMDQLLSGAGPEGVRYDRAIALLGVTDVALIDDVVEGLAAGDGSAVFGTVDRLVDAGHDPRRFATDLLDRLRDLVLLCAVPDAGERGLVSAPEDVLAKMIPQAQNIGPATLTRYAEVLHQGLTDMRGATAPRLLLELLCARMLLPSVSDAESAVLQRVERLEKHGVAAGGGGNGGAGGGPAVESKFQRPSQRQAEPEPVQTPAPVAVAPAVAAAPAAVAPAAVAPPVEPAPRQPPAAQAAPPQSRFQRPSQAPPQPAAPAEPAAPGRAPASGAVDAAEIRRRWPELLGVVKGASRSTEAMLTNATVTEVDGTSVTLAHTSGPLARRLAEPRNAEVIAKAFAQVLGGSWQIQCVQGNAAAPQRPQAQARQAKPAPSRPSQAESAPAPGHGRQMLEKAMQAQANRSTGRSGDDIPLPPEPDEPDDPLPPEPVDEEEMFAEAARPGEPGEERLDPEAVVLKLLADELGARPLKS
ncbi:MULTISPECIES: DNA polymerase III subunit gamma and tau [Actinosynnema]|uniref:DNA polymerase III subunit gamma and tau n=1 Tax=Actinosynnema TaxID=40566 RepID=UPI0020A59260|nr:DNA polymerase III subunit gamma and tau [Actinosynnema pretiosum]